MWIAIKRGWRKRNEKKKEKIWVFQVWGGSSSDAEL